MNRFDRTEYDHRTVTAARRTLETARSLDLSDTSAMARMLGRLEVVVERLIELADGTPDKNEGADHRTTGGAA
ncbi:hypothetical protein DLE01_30660 [Streptomyces sp. FT05W]|nr:hypothetical protein [Streptomyces sp. FT05W]PWS47513.1 hypothetical protein DLE01_30660 [Streptomyces sp. FT05W]